LDDFEVEQDRFCNGSWSFDPPEILNLKDKILSKGIKLSDTSGILITE
jgi:hypothetical protein